MQSKLLTLLSLAGAVHGHGRLLSPQARVAGSAFKTACGQTMFNIESSDPNGNIQGLAQQAAGSGFDASGCKLELCKGIPFEDNKANVQSYTPGQKIAFKVVIAAPHTGVANVSVVDTATNSIVGKPLISFENYASTKTGVAANNTDFSVTLPDSLPSQCATAGSCVLQWWWDSPTEAKQTYMSCVDFTSGSGSGSGSPSSAVPSATKKTTSAPAATTPTPKPTTTPGTGDGDDDGCPDGDSPLPANFTLDEFITWLNETADGESPLPATFTLTEFIAWLNETAGAGTAEKFRRHAREFLWD